MCHRESGAKIEERTEEMDPQPDVKFGFVDVDGIQSQLTDSSQGKDSDPLQYQSWKKEPQEVKEEVEASVKQGTTDFELISHRLCEDLTSAPNTDPSVQSVKHDLGYVPDIKVKSTDTVESSVIIGKEQDSDLGMCVMQEEVMCWDHPEAGEDDALVANNAMMCGQRDLKDEITIMKHEPCWDEEEVHNRVVVKKELVSNDREVRADVFTSPGDLKCPDNLKREPVDPEFVNLSIDRVEPQDNEAATVMSVDPLAGGEHDNEEHITFKKRDTNLPGNVSVKDTCVEKPPKGPNCVNSRSLNKNIAPCVKHDSDHQESLKCSSCIKTFPWKKSVVQHIKHDCGRQKPHKCPNCSKTFSWKNSLFHHRKHDCGRKEPHKCPNCGKTFSLKQNLLYHMKHDCGREEPHKCPSCCKMFLLKQNLQSHMKHDCGREEPHKCPNCSKAFTSRRSLLQHLNDDCGREEPHKCPNCSKTFTSKRSLLHHIKHHCGRKEPHKCPNCSNTFSWKQNLLQHIKHVCGRQEPHNCPSCKKTFPWKQSLLHHIQHDCCHQEPYKCPSSSKAFSLKRNLSYHM